MYNFIITILSQCAFQVEVVLGVAANLLSLQTELVVFMTFLYFSPIFPFSLKFFDLSGVFFIDVEVLQQVYYESVHIWSSAWLQTKLTSTHESYKHILIITYSGRAEYSAQRCTYNFKISNSYKFYRAKLKFKKLNFNLKSSWQLNFCIYILIDLQTGPSLQQRNNIKFYILLDAKTVFLEMNLNSKSY